MVMSPLPFGVHRVHHILVCNQIKAYLTLSPLPFGVHRVHHNAGTSNVVFTSNRLHCLSAFTAFTTLTQNMSDQYEVSMSPLPFGVHRVHHANTLETLNFL